MSLFALPIKLTAYSSSVLHVRFVLANGHLDGIVTQSLHGMVVLGMSMN